MTSQVARKCLKGETYLQSCGVELSLGQIDGFLVYSINELKKVNDGLNSDKKFSRPAVITKKAGFFGVFSLFCLRFFCTT